MTLRCILMLILSCRGVSAIEATYRDSDFPRSRSDIDIGVFAPGEERTVNVRCEIESPIRQVIDITTSCTCSMPSREIGLHLEGMATSLPVRVSAPEKANDAFGGVINLYLKTDSGMLCRSLVLHGSVRDPLLWPDSTGRVVDAGSMHVGGAPNAVNFKMGQYDRR